MSYSVEYAKSSRSSCRGCGSSIQKGVMRLGVWHEDEDYGHGYYRWHHVSCFASAYPSCAVTDFEGYNKLKSADKSALQQQLGSSGPKTSPIRSTNALRSVSPSRAAATNLSPMKAAPGNSIQSELSQLAGQYQSSNDHALLAKISCIIYKNCKDAVATVRFNPTAAINTIYQISAFLGDYYSRLPNDTLVISSAETVARAASYVISLSPYSQQMDVISSNIARWGINSGSAHAWCSNAKELARERKPQASGFAFA